MNEMVELYVRVPNRKALAKWSKHFNLSRSTVLSVLDLILNELEQRESLGTMKYPSNLGTANKVHQEIDLKECLKVVTLRYDVIKSKLSMPSEWPAHRLLKLACVLFGQLPTSVITTDAQQVMAKVMLKDWSNNALRELPMHVASVLKNLSTFQLCVLGRLAIYFIFCLRNKHPNFIQLEPSTRLQIISTQWQPLVSALCGIQEHSSKTPVVSCFLASYQYLLMALLHADHEASSGDNE
ncbi:hypothetical protein PHET_01785 [Paragonimus heterotremus]|uniref:Uncharacterized protein n=1 Tax=Paragonimus heterotremus TaxID=100268 RepID=A0A8J4X2Q9_9TREM|nr:hypothetical protein PHET_01785 [Paragonimus heterotremus]